MAEYAKKVNADAEGQKQQKVQELAAHLKGQKAEIATTQIHINELNQQAQQLEAQVAAARSSIRAIQSQMERVAG